MSSESTRPRLLRGQTAPVLPTYRQSSLTGEDDEPEASGSLQQLDPSVLAAMQRMSVNTTYNSSSSSGSQSYSNRLRDPHHRTQSSLTSLRDPNQPHPLRSYPSTSGRTTAPTSPVYPQYQPNGSTPSYGSSGLSSSSVLSQNSSRPQAQAMGRSSASTSSHYASPYILKSMGGAQQPLIEFSKDATGTQHILLVRLGRGFSNECLTVAARKGNILWLVADRWDREVDSKYEWHIQFDRDVDMTSIHANFDNGLLRITVKRRSL